MRRAALSRMAAALLAAVVSVVPAGAAAPARIVSLSLCTDQFLLAVAGREQIAGLTHLAGDPHLSPYAAQAAGLFLHDGTAEQVLLQHPDLVLAGSFARGATVEMLERLGVPVLRLKSPRSLAEIPDQVEQVADAVGRAEVGRALAASLRARLAPAATTFASAALYRPGGEVPGARSLVADMMQVAGLRNSGDHLTGRPNGRVAVESLVLDPPNLLVLDSVRPDRPGIGQSVLSHPALAAGAAGLQTVNFPILYWLCASPASIDGADILASRARQALAAGQGRAS